MKAKTAAQRKADERQRYRDAGLVKREVWIRPEHSERLAKYVARLSQCKATKEQERIAHWLMENHFITVDQFTTAQVAVYGEEKNDEHR